MKNFKHILIILFLLGSGTKIQAQYFIGFYTDKYDSDIQNDGAEIGSDNLTKKIHKEIEVSKDALIEIDNSYGDLNITSWDQDKVVIDVLITVKGENSKKTQKELNNIDVSFLLSPEKVMAETKIDMGWSFGWFYFGYGSFNSEKYRIDYNIKLPKTSSVDLTNDYGVIRLNTLEGKANISCDYGQLIIGELMADNNILDFDYTSNSSIEYINGGTIKADYSGFTIEKAEDIDLIADYTSSNIVEVTNLDYNCDYGNITIDNVTNLEGEGDYISHRIGNVSGSLEIDADYGSIKIDRIKSSAKNVCIEADYTDIIIGYENDYSFNFNINLQYGSFNADDELTIRKTDVQNSSKKYLGFHGTENSSNTVNINADYGEVKLIKYKK